MLKIHSKISNNRGAFLIEVLVSMAITIATVMVMLAALQQQNKATSYLEDRMARMNLERELALYFKDMDICKKSIVGFPISTTPQDIALKDASGNTIFDGNTKNSYEKLKILSLQLKNNNISMANKNGLVDVIATVESQRAVSGPKGPFTVKHSVFVYSSGATTVASCEFLSNGRVKVFGPYGDSSPKLLGKFQVCWMQKVGNLEDSHFCTIYYDETNENWMLRQYKSGCVANCV